MCPPIILPWPAKQNNILSVQLLPLRASAAAGADLALVSLAPFVPSVLLFGLGGGDPTAATARTDCYVVVSQEENDDIQDWAKEYALGCVNTPSAARGSKEEGFTQPRDHFFAQPCT